LLKRLEFRRKSRAFRQDYESLVQRADKELAESVPTIRDDYETLTKHGLAKSKDIYLFLRPLRLADTIRFPDEDMGRLITFEELLSDAIDSDGRIVGCVGNGGERWGAARISFDAEWRTGIIPLFKSAVVIISMPGVTHACLEESYLIRSKEELLAKTLFVLPPSECYKPPLWRGHWSLGEDFGKFRRRMVQVHRDMIGLHFPNDDGLFVIMDFETGKVSKSRPWKIVKMTTNYEDIIYGDRSITMKREPRKPSIDNFRSLDERDIRAAVNMVLHARGFI
jgi:hypothetical protein